MREKPLISIVIPVFNEEPTVGNVIEGVKAAVEKMCLPYEILVIDDCSTDNSLEISKSKKVEVYRLKRHMGKGYALRLGFKKAKGEIIVTLDSDGSHKPEELPKVLEPVLKNEVDLVVGSRFLCKENVFSNRLNKIGVQLFNFLIRVLTGKATTDSQSGYRAFKSAILRKMRLKSNGYEIESEMLVKALKIGLKSKEVSIRFEQRTYGKSKLTPLKDGIRIFISILTAYVGV
ncbi:MAG: glycosyltransferase family 2 protein [Candidatus Bathyarchaeota archaeon]|nr:glycosyltransferase family 2 protein [Candidatus Bathyarchaeota archaeon]